MGIAQVAQPKWAVAMANQGSGGAFEISNE